MRLSKNIVIVLSLITTFMTVIPVSLAGNGIANLPNTAACRQYLNYARGAGANGTLGPLTAYYNRCLQSRKRRPDIKKLHCGKGMYAYKYAGKWSCYPIETEE